MNPFRLSGRHGRFARRFGSALISILFFTGLGHVRLSNAAAKQQSDLPGGLDRYVAELIAKLPVTPGLAVAVVRGQKASTRRLRTRDVGAKLRSRRGRSLHRSTTKSSPPPPPTGSDEGKIDSDAPPPSLSEARRKATLRREISLRDLLRPPGISNEA